MKSLRISVLIALCFVSLSTPALSQTMEKGQSACFQIEKIVNAIVDYTQTTCVPIVATSTRTNSFILISSQPVFSVEASKKAWLIVAVAATGDVLNSA